MDDDLDEWTVTTKTGTSQLEVFKTQLVGVLAVLLRNLTISVFFNNRYNKVSVFLVDFITLVLPFLLTLTLLSNHLNELLIFLAHAIVALAGAKYFLKKENFIVIRPTEYLTYFRSAFLLGTVLAILAVDFRVFPRRFAKTESYGYSVMDLGTALFVFSHALTEFLATQRYNKEKTPFLTLFGLPIPAFAILFILGVGRAVVIYFTGYHQEVTEYGVHWNFFMTLCGLKIFSSIVPYPYSIPTGLVIGIGYQTTLANGLQSWILRRSRYRYGFLDENREGIYSLLGYIFLFSVVQLWARVVSNVNGILRPSKKSAFLILLTSIAFYGLQILSIGKFGRPSRRIANFAYVFSSCAVITYTLVVFQIIQFLGKDQFSKETTGIFHIYSSGINLESQPETVASSTVQEVVTDEDSTVGKVVTIETTLVDDEAETAETVEPTEVQPATLIDAISKNGLQFFLLANLVTGLVNLTISTPQYSDIPLQMTILTVYALVICEWIYLYNSGINPFKLREHKVAKKVD